MFVTLFKSSRPLRRPEPEMLFDTNRERRPREKGRSERARPERRDRLSGERASSKYSRTGRRGKKSRRLSDKIDFWLVFFAVAVVICRAYFVGRHKFRWPHFSLHSSRVLGIPLHPADASVIEDLTKRLDTFSVEIFSAPKPFVGADRESNRRAIESWLSLDPKPKVTLLGDEVGYDEAARDFDLRVEKRIDKTFLGIPLFNSMIDRANRSDASVAVVINGDILLTDDFMQTLRKVSSTIRNYLLIAARFDVDSLPNNETSNIEALRDHVAENVWAWNTDGPRLYGPEMPHFIFGRGKYDNWMTHEAIAAGFREVIDASETSLLVHVRHDYHLVSGNGDRINSLVSRPYSPSSIRHGRTLLSKQFWSEGKRSKFELFINIFLSLHVGTYVNQMGSVLYAPWKMGRCAESTGMCLARRKRPGMCPCEYSSFTAATQTDPVVKEGSRIIRCGMLSTESRDTFTIPVLPPASDAEPKSFGMPLTLKSISERVAENNTIILTALTFGYRSIMMNWVCNLRELGISNFAIAALDEDLYKYAFTRGLPTYFENMATAGRHDGVRSDASYGSSSFKQITKAKSRVVLRFLKLGVNVQWSDCDVIFFKNPLEHLWSHNADLVIQSNAPDNEALNGLRRLNSGFYLAVSSPRLIEAFEDIVDYARKSSMSEQPCFYDVLCGKDGANAVGTDGCRYKSSVSVKVLARELYPNGITNNIWNTEDGHILDKFPDLYIIHNNWMKGSAGKRDRFRRHRMVTFDSSTELCTYDSIVYETRRKREAAGLW